jgi:hypothetical protein
MAAVDKKLDEATEAYTRVAHSCVECHRLVRLQQHQAAVESANPKKP